MEDGTGGACRGGLALMLPQLSWQSEPCRKLTGELQNPDTNWGLWGAELSVKAEPEGQMMQWGPSSS